MTPSWRTTNPFARCLRPCSATRATTSRPAAPRSALAAASTRAAAVAVVDTRAVDLDDHDSGGSGGHTGSILMLTARHTVGDRVSGLDAGADDYLVKPFALDDSPGSSLGRRHIGVERIPPGVELGDLVIDVGTRRVTRSGAPIDLTKFEFELLHLLVANAPTVLSRDQLYQRVWGYDQENASNSLEVFISQLRRKLEADGGDRLIHTVRGIGYTARTA